MYQYDFINIILRDLSEIIAKVVFNKSIRKYDECHAEVGNALSLFGMSYDLLSALSPTQLAQFISGSYGISQQYYLKMAMLLATDADVYLTEEKVDVALVMARKALAILEMVPDYEGSEDNHLREDADFRVEFKHIQTIIQTCEKNLG